MVRMIVGMMVVTVIRLMVVMMAGMTVATLVGLIILI